VVERFLSRPDFDRDLVDRGAAAFETRESYFSSNFEPFIELRTPRTLTESRCPVLRRSDSGLWIPVGDEAA
jgi:hypothetical protein